MEQDRRNNQSVGTDSISSLDLRNHRSADDSSFMLLRSNIVEAGRILMLRRWTFFVPFCVVTCIGAIASHWITRKYESSTVIERRDHPVLMNLRQTDATGGFAGFFRPTLTRDLTSIETLSEVVASEGLISDLEYDATGELTEASKKRCEARAASLAGGVSVRLVKKSDHFDQIKISYACTEPGLAQEVTRGLKNAYVRRTRAKLTEILREGKSYFDNIAQERRVKASNLEEDLLRFQAEYIGIDPTNPGALKLKITSLETRQDETRREIETLEREVESRRGMLEGYRKRIEFSRAQTAPRSVTQGQSAFLSIAKSSEAQALETEIRHIQDDIHEFQLARGMTDRHPDIVDRRKRITRLREKLKGQYLEDARALPANRGVAIDDAVADSAVEAAVGWDVELSSLQMALQDRLSRYEAARNRLVVIEQDLIKHHALEQNVFRYRKDYTLKAELLSQAEEEHNANKRRAMEIASILEADESQRGIFFNVLSPASSSTKPVNPRGTTVIVFAMLGGLAVGAVSVLLRELFDQSYHTAKQVTRSLGLALLETVDEIMTSADRARRFRRRVVFTPAVVSVLIIAVSISCATAYLSLEKPRTYQRVMGKPRAIWHKFRPAIELAQTNHNTIPAPAPATATPHDPPDGGEMAMAEPQGIIADRTKLQSVISK